MAATGWNSDSDDDDYPFDPPLFEEVFLCLPFSRYKHPHLESGDKIVLPASTLSQILDFSPKFPLIFRLQRENAVKFTHCGVLEFDAEEGSVYMPEWMMKNLNMSEGDGACVRYAELLQGVYMKLQPHAAAFVNEMSNPKAVLEWTMRGLTCLTCGDTIMIKHNDREFYFNVLEVAPGTAISLVDTDCAVEFAAALDYEEPESGKKKERVEEKEEEEATTSFRPFTGKPRRLDGKAAEGGGGVVAAVEEEEDEERKEGGGDEKWKPFTGRSRVVGRGF